MKIKNLNPDKLKAFNKNPKIHDSKQIKQLISSIEEFGFTNPILAIKHEKENLVIAGHARLMAAKDKGLRSVPVIFLDLPYEKAIAYNITDNRLAESSWNEPLLLEVIDDLKLEEHKLEIIGFNSLQIDSMKARHSDNEDDVYKEWGGMPEYEHEENYTFKSLIVHFKEEEDFNIFLDKIEYPSDKITPRTKYIWFPQRLKDRKVDHLKYGEEKGMDAI